MRKSGLPLAGFLGAALVSITATAGVYMESTDVDLAANEPAAVTRMWFDGGRMRTERSETGIVRNIALFKNDTMYVINPRSKSYHAIDKATIERVGDRVAEARRRMQDQMASLSPEQRALLEKMTGGAAFSAPPPTRTLKNTGRTETVAGIRCTIWEATVNGAKKEELCAAAPGVVAGGSEVTGTLREIGEMMKGFTENFTAPGRKSASPWSDMETIRGVPILTREFSDGKAILETRLTAVRVEPAPAAAFDVPAGYQERKLGPASVSP